MWNNKHESLASRGRGLKYGPNNNWMEHYFQVHIIYFFPIYITETFINCSTLKEKRPSCFKLFLAFRSLFTNTLRSSVIYHDLSYKLPYIFFEKKNKENQYHYTTMGEYLTLFLVA
jgi:hypothetical protein